MAARQPNTRLAIELMTAWASEPDGPAGGTPSDPWSLLSQRMQAALRDRAAEDPADVVMEALAGFINLSAYLLTLRLREVGKTEQETLQAAALWNESTD